MTDDIVLSIKEIMDRAGLGIDLEQIEAGLSSIADDRSDVSPSPEAASVKVEAGQCGNGAGSEEDTGVSLICRDNCYVASGRAELVYSGAITKRYEGDVVLLLKPDHSLVVHGLRGVSPVSYLARAMEVRSREKDGTLAIEAVAGKDRLTVTFLKVAVFEGLFEGLPDEAKKQFTEKPAAEKPSTDKSPVDKPAADRVVLNEEEKALEARLKGLRIDLARQHGISYLPAVFDNRMLYRLIRERPKTPEDLRQIKGFGAKRIERYAARVLEAINGTPEERPAGGSS